MTQEELLIQFETIRALADAAIIKLKGNVPVTDAIDLTPRQMIEETLKQSTVLPSTRTLLNGIMRFQEDYGYLSEKQLSTIRAMYQQHAQVPRPPAAT